MGKFFSPFENFVFKSFDFNGRASLLEYWLVMPLIWALIFFLLWGDAVEFWGFLLVRQVPPLNPLYWDGILVFLVTIIPRLSLTVRRLHDSGKNGKWAKLPFVALTSGLVLTVGIFSAMATSGVAGGAGADALTVVAIFMAFVFGAADSAWDVIFSTAITLNAIGWDAIIALLAEMSGPEKTVNVSHGVSNIGNALKEQPAESGSILLIALVMVAAPFIAAFLHIFFMISPSKPDHAVGLNGPIAGSSLRQKGEVSNNPFAGYKYLYAQDPERKAAHKAAAKEEIRNLYQQRVLGQQTG